MWRGLRRCFSVVKGEETSFNELLGKELGQGVEEYSKALEFVKENQYFSAETEFRKCLEILESNKLYGEPSYNFILLRLALMLRAQNKLTQTEKTMEEIVSNYKAREKQYPEQLCSSYENLLKQYLVTSVDKAIMLGHFLMREENWKILQRHTQKDVKFLLGTAYALRGDTLSEAKEYFTECLKMNPGPNTCFVLHNLACTQWWHVLKYKDSDPNALGEETEEFRQATVDFSEAIPNLQKAIQLLEDKNELYTPNLGNLDLKNKLSGLSITNIAEIHFQSANLEVS